MTIHHPGHPTKPLVLGAPLPSGAGSKVDAQDVADELRRAEIELLYAISQHRKAWKVMRRRAELRNEQSGKIGMLSTLESDPHWKKATGDVDWWRGEMTAQATTVLALQQMLLA